MALAENQQDDRQPDCTVLIVDDNSDILDTPAPVLSKSFNVLVTTNAAEATRTIGNQRVDVLLTDIVMPGVNGLDLADRARSLRPDLCVIYITGYSGEAGGTDPGDQCARRQ
jgi:DNA-binding NtrC family response regulator